MIKLANFSISLDIPDNSIFTGLDIYEQYRCIPYFELGIQYQDNKTLYELYKSPNINLEYSSENLNYKCVLGVNSISCDGSNALLKGWLINTNLYKIRETKYLGSSVRNAIRSINTNYKLNAKNDIKKDVFQINRSSANELVYLCDLIATYPYWSISRGNINLDLPEKIYEKEHISSGGDLTIISNAKQLNQKTSLANKLAVSNLNNCYIISDNTDVSINLAKNINLTEASYSPIYSSEIKTEYELPIGNLIENPFIDLTWVKYWVVTSCYYHYRATDVFTDILYMGVQNL